MILADENIDHKLIKELRLAGFDVFSIYESRRGSPDESIIEMSRNPPKIILTEDKDFGEWVYAHNVKDISVLFLRYHFKDTDSIVKILLELLSKQRENLFGHFTTVTIHKIRSRPF
ncbi:DUF5615 family PIN-like protein [Dyadobacter psychrotolerans]|uniref:DUF5615 family PIN-like protein n=1 Tax=Dyadobacter psychrotolerans TaxID=2541721 RepID=UPI001405087E